MQNEKTQGQAYIETLLNSKTLEIGGNLNQIVTGNMDYFIGGTKKIIIEELIKSKKN